MSFFTINNQKIPYAFRGYLAKRCGGLYNADRAICRYRKIVDNRSEATQKEKDTAIIRYIQKVLKEGNINITTAEEDSTPKQDIQDWIDKHILKSKKKTVESLGTILRNVK